MKKTEIGGEGFFIKTDLGGEAIHDKLMEIARKVNALGLAGKVIVRTRFFFEERAGEYIFEVDWVRE